MPPPTSPASASPATRWAWRAAPGVSLRISAASLPVYDHALALAGDGVKTKGTTSNQAHYQASVRVAEGIAAPRAGLIYDPQTAGGLLIALDGDRAEAFVASLRARGVAHATIIGEVVARRRATRSSSCVPEAGTLRLAKLRRGRGGDAV